MLLSMVLLYLQSLSVGARLSYSPPQKGQGLVEYALVLVLVAVVVIAILTLLGPQIGNVFSRIVCGLDTACATN